VSDDGLLAQQRAYYRKRAPDYDAWWQRRGDYDHGEADTEEWNRQVALVADALSRFAPDGDVLEIAGGTGWWTEHLARTAGTLTVVDSSPEAIAINRARVQRPDVTYVERDVFQWEPDRRYDVVFFSFWLSHVPRARFAWFWDLVDRSLAPGGRAFFIDNRRDPTLGRRDPHTLDERDDVQRRRLDDGSEHNVVKVFYEPPELTALLTTAGWDADIAATRWFIYGSARRGAARD
jgi:demethylmenaquinone methyltransferase/2-methoxy-6-polyprenyl-1,4-benzoquinol methylase